MSTISLIIKVTDQCNLGCPYCYYYSGGNASLRARKVKNRDDLLERISTAIVDSKAMLSMSRIDVVLHGGEPLLAGILSLDKFCSNLNVVDDDRIHLSCQTNGTLISDDWIDFFIKWKVAVGISIDAVKEFHDERRSYTNGNGSFTEAVDGLRRLSSSRYASEIGLPGVISVYDPRVSAEQYFEFFLDDLKVKGFNILFPDESYASIGLYRYNRFKYNNFLQDMWDEYCQRDDPSINFSFFSGLFQPLKRRVNSSLELGYNNDSLGFLVIDLKGDVFFDDGLRYAFSTDELRVGNIFEESFDAVFAKASEKLNALKTLPPGCRECDVLKLCGGGPFVYRYSPMSGKFDDYLMCESTQMILKEYILPVTAKRQPLVHELNLQT